MRIMSETAVRQMWVSGFRTHFAGGERVAYLNIDPIQFMPTHSLIVFVYSISLRPATDTRDGYLSTYVHRKVRFCATAFRSHRAFRYLLHM